MGQKGSAAMDKVESISPTERDTVIGKITILRAKPGKDFVVTPTIESICKRALSYLDAGYAVHLYGPAGTGKTTLAIHLAGLIGRPVMLIYGDEQFGTADLIGRDKGLFSRKVVDNFVHSVIKTEESLRMHWADERITTACKHGYTLIYDEFSRSRPEANNILLSILEEKILAFPGSHDGEPYLQVHPDFRIIFTSNPDEYAGVHKAQGALMDRMVSIKLNMYDRETVIAITSSRSKVSIDDAAKIVGIVSEYAERNRGSFKPTLRAGIMIARLVTHLNAQVSENDPVFFEICADVLALHMRKEHGQGERQELKHIIKKYCQSRPENFAQESCRLISFD